MKNHFSLYTRSAALTSLQLLLALLACITLESAFAAGDEALQERIDLRAHDQGCASQQYLKRAEPRRNSAAAL